MKKLLILFTFIIISCSSEEVSVNEDIILIIENKHTDLNIGGLKIGGTVINNDIKIINYGETRTQKLSLDDFIYDVDLNEIKVTLRFDCLVGNLTNSSKTFTSSLELGKTTKISVRNCEQDEAGYQTVPCRNICATQTSY